MGILLGAPVMGDVNGSVVNCKRVVVCAKATTGEEKRRYT
jgi:hypothetical protein